MNSVARWTSATRGTKTRSRFAALIDRGRFRTELREKSRLMQRETLIPSIRLHKTKNELIWYEGT